MPVLFAGGSLKRLPAGSIGLAAGGYVYSAYPISAAALSGFSTRQPVTLIRSTKPWMPFDRAVLPVSARATARKSILPDAHADYVFAVAAEEGGLLIGGFIILTFAFPCVARARALRERMSIGAMASPV